MKLRNIRFEKPLEDNTIVLGDKPFSEYVHVAFKRGSEYDDLNIKFNKKYEATALMLNKLLEKWGANKIGELAVIDKVINLDTNQKFEIHSTVFKYRKVGALLK